jgi:VWFA-related protein
MVELLTGAGAIQVIARRGYLRAKCITSAITLSLALTVVDGQTAQLAGQTAEVSARDVPLTFRTKVNLVSVPVVVRDAQGRAISGLSREDFQVLDSGKPQTISRFAIQKFGADQTPSPGAPAAAPESQPSPAAPAPPERYIAYVFDDVNTTANDLSQAREAAMRHILTSLRPVERAAVYTTSGQGGVDFTADRDKLRQALLAIRPQNPITNSHSCPPMTIYHALAISKNDVQALGAAIGDYKVCGPPMPPGEDAEILAETRARNTARESLALADRNISTVFANLDGIVKKLSMMAGLRTIVLVSSGFLVLDDRRQEESAVLERAVRAGVVVNSLDARALFALAPGLDASAHTFDSEIGDLPPIGSFLRTGLSADDLKWLGNGGSSLLVKNQMARTEALANRDVMAEIAANTGGRFFENSNDLRGGFDRLAAAPEYVYVLGFAPQDLKLDGRYHSLKVTLRNSKGFTLEARRGYYAPRYGNDPAERIKAEIEEAFFSRTEAADIPVSVQTQFFKTGDYEATVSVAARIDVRHLPFKKEAERNRDELTVVAGLFDADGNYVKGTQKVVDLNLRGETLAGRLQQGITVRNTFDVPPGTYFVRFVVRDSQGQSLSAHSGSVEVP